MGLIDSWRKSLLKGRSAVQRLDDYPPYRAPHVDLPINFGVEAARANLEYLLSSRGDRLAAIGAHLRKSGVDIRGALAGEDHKPLLRAIHQWAAREWPDYHDPSIATREVWLVSSRSGQEIVYSMLMDVAILFGELITTRRREYTWSLDLDPGNKADGMISYNRPVVQIPKGEPFPAPIIFDLEYIVVSCYFRCRSPLFSRIDELTRPVTDAISGAHEAYWLQSHDTTGQGKKLT